MAENVPVRSYGCSFGCGNPYDYIVVSVADGSTEFLCMPCYVKLATEIIEAVTNPDSEKVRAALADAGTIQQTVMNGPGPKRRGKNAPAGTEDPDLIEAFDSVITVDELPPEFR
jgi:hypothetical protein